MNIGWIHINIIWQWNDYLTKYIANVDAYIYAQIIFTPLDDWLTWLYVYFPHFNISWIYAYSIYNYGKLIPLEYRSNLQVHHLIRKYLTVFESICTESNNRLFTFLYSLIEINLPQNIFYYNWLMVEFSCSFWLHNYEVHLDKNRFT